MHFAQAATARVEQLAPTVQYSTVNNPEVNNSTVQYSGEEVLNSISDLVANPSYLPFYDKKLKEFGAKRFMEIANKARAGSDTPAILFRWMLKNPHLVK